mgnify:CR=1 FL=1
MSTVRDEARKVVEQLSDDATWADLMYAIYVRQKIEAGQRAVAEGKTVELEVAEERMSRWLDA